ncbi:MAG: hypothetical protein HN833_02460 [Elusimicrobiaceae bacterium]|jgi:hypothetical protein|nr:hypothetical protein [Elusimicrobiaceae bacterium]MBT3954845.1 hypothetical protein [Elusimicrobiaceae bacterium]MBT4008408.1 hypothetical protein [Elusimicrobiaceae bacterium]MBT4402936.1 hypothetical protein [Elusimicrobiaceae bacterium]MBT4439872.1 hypothetical protein [Elusimicrobiaceae bacterium]
MGSRTGFEPDSLQESKATNLGKTEKTGKIQGNFEEEKNRQLRMLVEIVFESAWAEAVKEQKEKENQNSLKKQQGIKKQD